MEANKRSRDWLLIGSGLIGMILFPIVPSILKPICVLSFVPGFLFFVRRGMDIKPFIGPLLIYVVAALSIFQSNDFYLDIKKLETLLPLMAFPLIFSVIQKVIRDQIEKEKWRKFFLLGFLFFSTCLVGIMFSYVLSLGFYSELVSYDYSMSYIDAYMWIANDHPIYLSLIYGISVILGVEYLVKYNSSMLLKSAVFIGVFMCLWGIFFLERKGIIIALFCSLFYYLWVNLRISIRIKRFLTLFLALAVVFVILHFSSRFKEMLSVKTFTTELDVTNSTSIRFRIYQCVNELVDECGFFGLGIGGQQSALNSCYETKNEFLLKGNYNTHNQFASFLLGTGWFGFLIFVFANGLILYNGFKFNSVLLVAFVIFFCLEMMTENLLERQTGVILYSFIMVFFTFTDFKKGSIE